MAANQHGGWRGYQSFGVSALGLAPAADAELGVPSTGQNARPGTGPGGINAGQLQPDSRAGNMAAGVPYQMVPAYPPFVRLANSPDIAYFPRFRSLVFGGNAVLAATTVQQVQFSVPTIILARTGSAYDASGAGLPVGRTGLQLFRVQFSRVGSSTDLIDAGAGNAAPNITVLAENVLGPAGLPGFFQGNGLFVDTGGFINVTCQILLNNVEAHVSLLCLEEYGPSRG